MGDSKSVRKSAVGDAETSSRAEPALPSKRVELVWEGKRAEVDRVTLPFQPIEIVNESRATREAEKGTFLKALRSTDEDSARSPWRNKLIWGDNKYVVGSLLQEFAGKIQLVYIDPPFATGQDFSVQVEVGDEKLIKEPSLIEEKAYRDTWGSGLPSYLQMMHDRLRLVHELLAADGSIYVHCDRGVSSHLRLILDEVFGPERFRGEIIWKRTSAHSDSSSYGQVHESILFYSKGEDLIWTSPKVAYEEWYVERYYRYVDKDGRRFMSGDLGAAGLKGGGYKYTWKGVSGVWRCPQSTMADLDAKGKVFYTENGVPRFKRFLDEMDGRPVQSLWDDIQPVVSWAIEMTGYATQKPESLLERVITASSKPGDLIADFFAGSGTTGAVAERLKRRWVMCDLSRWAIQVARKRLLDIEGCSPFEVLNLGRYERQYWQGVTFGGTKRGAQTALHEYVKFILELYRAEPASGLVHLHGQRGGRMIHVGAADAPVTLSEIRDALGECRKVEQTKLDVLGWEWEMGLHDVVEDEARKSGVQLRLLNIPREVMDQRAVEAGDVHFYELAHLEVESETEAKRARLRLKSFVIPSPELIPDEVRKKIRKWSDFMDYWSVDFEFNEDVFHNQWQDYRTRAKRDLCLVSDWHDYAKPGRHKVLVKVFDIFGNDTTQLLEVRV